MLVIPAIDIIEGKCVRLLKGDYSAVTKYSDDPLNVAKNFKDAGAQIINVIDLDGARIGESKNIEIALKIISTLNIDVQFGGGVRTYNQAVYLLDSGIKRIILGTVAITSPILVKKLIKKYGKGRIIVATDFKDGQIAINGWQESSGQKLNKFLEQLKGLGVETILFTDIKKDGTLQGPDFNLIKNVVKSGFKVIVAGGISSVNDLEKLSKIGAYAAVLGKAIYEKKIDLKLAISKIQNNLAKRIIPCMDVKNGRVVKGIYFKDLKDAGDPVVLGKLYSDMGADELVFLDIMATVEGRKIFRDLVSKISENINIPFTVGGGINDLEDIKNLLDSGADKVAICSAAVKNPNLIKSASKKFGSQCIVISIDAKKSKSGWEIYINGGRVPTGIDAIEFAKKMEKLGAGELLVNSLDRDGTKSGYDLKLLKLISESVNIPVIASSGAGKKEDFLEVFEKAHVDAVLAASLFHSGAIKIPKLKKYLQKNNITIRI